LIKVTGTTDVNKLKVTIEDKDVKIIPDQTQSGNFLSFEVEVEVPQGITPGRSIVGVKYDGGLIDSRYVDIPDPSHAPGKQPEILKIDPVSGIEGADITIVGRNFGNDLSKVKIWLEKREKKDGKEVYTKVDEPIKPLSVPDQQNQQQRLRFTIPTDQKLIEKHWLSNKARLYVTVDSQPSNNLDLTVVVSNWRIKVLLLAVMLIIVLLGLLAITVKKWDILKTVFIDKKTNTYSLSKCQAFAWTVILIGSYFYLAIGRGLILCKGVIPDFNPSLLGLMGISYSGTLAACKIDARIPKNDLTEPLPRLSDLFSEGGEISLPRFQLVGFTVAAILIYVYNLTSADLLVKGLPDIPLTLLGLLGGSQLGYIGGKVLGDRLAVNYVVPRRIQLGREGVKLTLIGSGLIANTKVLFQDHHQLIDAQLLNSSSLSVDLPKFSLAGWKQLVLVPPTGSSIVLSEVIEVVDAKIEKVEYVPNNSRQVKLTLKGFDLKEVQSTITGKPAITVSIDEANNLLTLEAEADIKSSDDIKITSADGQLESEMKVP
jgi:hypothetical protein